MTIITVIGLLVALVVALIAAAAMGLFASRVATVKVTWAAQTGAASSSSPAEFAFRALEAQLVEDKGAGSQANPLGELVGMHPLVWSAPSPGFLNVSSVALAAAQAGGALEVTAGTYRYLRVNLCRAGVAPLPGMYTWRSASMGGNTSSFGAGALGGVGSCTLQAAFTPSLKVEAKASITLLLSIGLEGVMAAATAPSPTTLQWGSPFGSCYGGQCIVASPALIVTTVQ